jgi:hypothetical protein
MLMNKINQSSVLEMADLSDNRMNQLSNARELPRYASDENK